MSKVLAPIAFILVAVGIVVVWHWYLWARLVRDIALPSPLTRIGTVTCILLALSMPLGMILARGLPFEIGQKLAYLPFAWMGIAFILLFALLGVDSLKLLHVLVERVASLVRTNPQPLLEMSAEMRLLATRASAMVTLIVAFGAGLYGLWQLRQEVPVKQVTVILDRLPAELDGVTLLQLTDIHIGAPMDAEFLRRVVAQCNAQQADFVVITGDLVDGDVGRLKAATSVLGELRAKHGVFFVTGNHEYYSGAEQWVTYLRSIGVQVLDNQHVEVRLDERGQQSIVIAGVPDPTAKQLGIERAPNLTTALQGKDENLVTVLLAHQPKVIDEAANTGVDLVLSGHTHNGQIWPFTYLVALTQPFVEGLHRVEQSQIYVSQGTGVWGPPMRIGTQSEITRIELKAAKK